MHDILLALVSAAGGTVVPWSARTVLRLVRGDAEREERQAVASAARELAEIERLTSLLADAHELVDLLRRALDKHLIRESAIAGMAELLITVIKLVPHPTDAMLHVLIRAEEVLELARKQIDRINRGEA